ncbi:MAG: ABC transporter permease [Planctomycetota bacterium]|nr:ABC transporter permease [Planctomycetota bacterium]
MYRSFLSWRYLYARRTNLVGIVGIFVGVSALILILSIMTGFLEQSRNTVRGSLSDLIVAPFQGDTLSGWTRPRDPDGILAVVRAQEGVDAASPHLTWFGLIALTGQKADTSEVYFSSASHGSTVGVQFVGVDVRTTEKFAWMALQASLLRFGIRVPVPAVHDEFTATELFSALTREPRRQFTGGDTRVANPLFPFARPPGYEPLGRPKASVVLGEQLLASLLLERGDEIQLTTVVRDTEDGEWRLNSRDFAVAGTFRSQDNDFDLGRIYMDRRELADFLGDSMRFTEVLVRLDDYDRDGERIRDELFTRLNHEQLINGGFRSSEVRTWEDFRGNLLGAIRNERFLMAIMLSLVLLVAGFTVFAILSMMVTEKRRDIGILMAIGATPHGVLHLFLMIAFWDALIGTVLGAFAGTWAAIKIDAIERWLSARLGFEIFDRSVYMFDHIPSVVQPVWVAAIVLGAFTCTLFFAAFPAWRAARLDPLEALRYE